MRWTPPDPRPRPEQVWGARELWMREGWRMRLPEEVAGEVVDLCRSRPDLVENLAGYAPDAAARPHLAAFGRSVRRRLLLGEGVAWIRGLAELGLDPAEQRLGYLALGRSLGEPMLQYGLLYEVRDRGMDHRDQAVPVSMTGAGTDFHTDSSAAGVLPDFVALLCEEPSRRGGDSLVSNALRVHELMRRSDPDLLEVLYRPFVRDLVTPGVPKTRANLLANRIPVFARCRRPEGLVFRYMRYWIEKGQERAGEPLDDTVLAALDRLDELLAADEQSVCFRLEAGDVLVVNNRTLAHNRTDYHDTPDNVRLLHRMWIQASPVAARAPVTSERAATVG